MASLLGEPDTPQLDDYGRTLPGGLSLLTPTADRPAGGDGGDVASFLDRLLARQQQQAAPVAPIWDTSNPVGTERIGEQSLSMPRGPFDPVVGQWPTGKPMTQSEYDSVQQTSLNLFDQLSAIMPSSPGVPRMAAASRGTRRPPGRPRPPEPVAMNETPPPIGHNMPPELLPLETAPPPAPAPAATVADIGGGQRGMMAVPSLRSMTPAQAADVAATQPHLIPKEGGGFVGAPAHVKTPADLQMMRDNLDAAVDAGAEGRDWYVDSRGFISDITGNKYDPATNALISGVPGQARRTAEGLTVFSPQADPGTNLQFFLQARNAYARGQPIDLARNRASATKYNTGMAAKEAAEALGLPEPDIPQGPKTGPFGWHLSPDRPYGTTGVNDIWHARSFGYRNPDGSEFDGSPTTQQHMFMDYETVLAIDRANARAAGGFTDWNAANVQAAPWVANKEASLRARYPNWSDERVHETALKSFQDFAQGSTASLSHEQVPGQSTGLLDLLPEPKREAFSLLADWRDPTGRDALIGQSFLQPPMSETQGTYINSQGQYEANPATTSRPLVDFVAKSDPREIHPGTQAALSGVGHVRGLVDMQEGTPWHYIDTSQGQAVRDTSSMRLTGPRPTVEQLGALQDVAGRHGYHVADTGDGVSLINAGAEPSPRNGTEQAARLKAGLADEINRAMPGATITPGRASGGYADLADELASSVQGEGRATSKVLADLENMKTAAPRMYEDLVNNPAVATKAQANLDRLQAYGMAGARPDYVRLLQIVSGGGLQNLLRHVGKMGAVGLPAALFALAPRGETSQ